MAGTISADELQAIMVRIIGDATNFQAMIASVISATESAVKNIEDAAFKIQGISKEMESFANTALGVLKNLGLSASLGGALTKFMDFEKAGIRLEAMLVATGQDAKVAMNDYDNFAKSMAKTTMQTRLGVLGMVEQTVAMGLSGDTAKHVIKDAIALASAKGGEASGWIRVANAVRQGNATLIRRRLMMQGVKDDHEVLEQAQKMITAGWAATTKEVESLSGMLDKLQKTFSGLVMDMGELIAHALTPLIKGIKDAADWFKALDPSIKRVMVNVLLITGLFLAMGPAIKMGLALIVPLMSPIAIIALGAAIALGVVVEQMGGVEKSLETVGGYIQGVWDTSVKWVMEWISANRGLVLSLVALGTAIGAVYLAVRIAATVFTVLHALFVLLKVQQIASALLWLAWQAALLAASAVMGLFNTMIAVGEAIVSGYALALFVWTTFVGLATVATWLWNAALAVMNVLLAPVTVAVFLIALAWVAAALAVATAAAMAAWAALGAVLTVLSQIPSTTGPLGAIGDIFGEWLGIIQDIIKAIQTDMPLAWELAQAGFELAVTQFKTLWGPTWKFIGDGFSLLWDVVVETFKAKFNQVMAHASAEPIRVLTEVIGGPNQALFAALMDRHNEIAKFKMNQAVANAEFALNEALKGFDAVTEESQATKDARFKLSMLQELMMGGDVDKEKKKHDEERDQVDEKLHQKAMHRVREHTEHITAALWGSAEAVTRISAYIDNFYKQKPDVYDPTKIVAVGDKLKDNPPEPAKDKVVEILTQIRDVLKQQGKDKDFVGGQGGAGVVVNGAPAGFGQD